MARQLASDQHQSRLLAGIPSEPLHVGAMWARCVSQQRARWSRACSARTETHDNIAGKSNQPPCSSKSTDTAVPSWVKMALGVGGFLVFDDVVKRSMELSGLTAYLPSQIGGMLAAFAGLSLAACVSPQSATSLHSALLPGVAWVSRWLPVFLVPVQVMLPTIQLPGGASEAGSLVLLLTGGWLLSLGMAAGLAALLQKAIPVAASAVAGGAAAAAPQAGSMRLPLLWLLIAAGSFVAGAAPSDQFAALSAPQDDDTISMFQRVARGLCLVSLGVGSYAWGLLQGKPGHVNFLICGGTTILGAVAIAAARGESFTQVVRRDYMAGGSGAGDYLIWFLGPALVSTGVQMFQYRARIRSYGLGLLGCCALASLVNILGTAAVAPWMNISPEVALAATMRCVTVPMALPSYDRLMSAADGTEGNVGLIALCAGASGFLGFGLAKAVLSGPLGVSIAQPLVRGVAVGSSAHVLGSVTFAASEPEALAWGMLAMAFSGIASAAWVSACPAVRDLTVSLAHGGQAPCKVCKEQVDSAL